MQIFRILMRVNIRVLVVILLLGLGAIFYIGARTSPIIVFVFSVCIISIVLSTYLAKWVLAKDEGPPEMAQVIVIKTLKFLVIAGINGQVVGFLGYRNLDLSYFTFSYHI